MAGSVFAWGDNQFGQLGNKSFTSSNTPVQVKSSSVFGVNNLAYIKMVSASYHCLALTSDGGVWAWGNNQQGQVGDASYTNRNTAVLVKSVSGSDFPYLMDIKAVSAGRLSPVYTAHSLALRADGQVFAWGANGFGQLGDGFTANQPIPVKVVGLPNEIVALSGGPATSLALAADGKVFAWGNNQQGQLGNGTSTNSPNKIPIQVGGGLSNIVAVSSSLHSLALRADGNVFAWGWNPYGQLGNGNNSPSTTPMQVGGLSNIVAVSAGYLHSLALRWDGAVFAWGRNEHGQLGNGTTNDSKIPIQVGGLSNITAVSAGYYASAALGSDGEVYTWGDNTDGSLGNGNNISSPTPVQVPNLGGVLALSMGTLFGVALV